MSRSAIRETLGFVGVIASLIFVGLEIQQNTLASRASAIQESTSVARQQVQMFATDAEVNRINMLGAQDPSQLNAEEQSRYRWIVLSFLWGMQGLYRQWELGVLPDQEWQGWNTIICWNMANPGMREVWQGLDFYTPDFVEIVEACDSFQGA